MSKKSLQDVDLYELLGVETTSNETEIRKAYRKKALACHPDKNPDNPKAAELFHELSQALEILTDASAKAAYDKVLNAKKAAQIRHRELDSKRRKLIEDLERREKEAELKQKSSRTFDLKTDEEKLQAEIARLQKEGSKLLEEEQVRLKQQIESEAERLLKSTAWDSSQHRIKINWKTEKGDDTNGGYTEEMLRRFFKKYGDIVALVVSHKKKGSALVEFSSKEASEMALDFEKGLPENPLSLKWVKDDSKTSQSHTVHRTTESSLINERDYESLVLTKMRQAAERQKLIDEMMKEES